MPSFGPAGRHDDVEDHDRYRPGLVPVLSLLKVVDMQRERPRLWLGVLGPVECTVEGSPVQVSGGLNRALLAALAVNSDRVSATDGLVAALWGEAPPAAAEKVVRNRVSIAEQLDGGIDPNLLVGAVEQLVAHEPFRERRWVLLMRTLYLAGRQHDALGAFQRARHLLREELGLSPGSELLALEKSILNQESSLRPAALKLSVTRGGLSNLPARPSRLIGREGDVARVRQLLAGSRLVTVTGVGGSGKTRLAIAVGEAELAYRPTGVWLVDLTAVMNGVDVPAAIANAIRLMLRDGAPTDQVVAYLADKVALVILDNCEHVIDACAEFTERFLRVNGQSVILATSREAIDVEGERTMVLGPLTSDGPRSRAVQLFVDRATAVDAHFQLTDANAGVVAALCDRLDGMPLAIELAAARVPVMTPAELLIGLDNRFAMLAGGRRRQRHRSLQATMDWSYDLLDRDEQAVFRALGVFVDGFDIDAVAAVTTSSRAAALAVVQALVSKSLVVRIEEREPARFRLLETVKAYAEDRLVQLGNVADIRNAHLAYFHRLAGAHGRNFFGEVRLGVRLRVDRCNLTSAFEWAASTGQWIVAGELLVGAHIAYVLDGYLPEVKALIDRAIEHCEPTDHELAECLRAVSLPTLSWLGDREAYVHRARALTMSTVAAVRAFAWPMLSYVVASSDPDEARKLLVQAQTEGASAGRSDGRTIDASAGLLAYIPAVLAASEGDHAMALRLAQQALAVEERSDYRTVLGLSATQLAAACHIALGEPARALETLTYLEPFDFTFFRGNDIRALAYIALGDHDQAQRFIRAHARQAATGQISGQTGDSVLLLAALAHAEGDSERAADLLLQMGIGQHAATRMFSAHLAARLGVASEHARLRREVSNDGPDEQAATDTTVAMIALRRERTLRGWDDPSDGHDTGDHLAVPAAAADDDRGRIEDRS